MSRAASIPADTDLLCERCGYVLNGLSDEGRCPECGTPIAESRRELRKPSAWDLSTGISFVPFLTTTAAVIFRPTSFYRGLTMRTALDRSRRFAIIHWLISSCGFALLGWNHFTLQYVLFGSPIPYFWLPMALFVLSLSALILTTFAAAKLTAVEAAYRGLRLSRNVVSRAMYFHAAHYLPVAFAGLGIVVIGMEFVLGQILPPTTYLYILCGYVIVAAIYLFQTYWIGMRNVMYANG